MKRISLFNCEVDVGSMSETVEVIGDRLRGGLFTQHVVVNVAKIVNMQRDEKLAASVRECDLINIDGMGVVWAARALGYEVAERVAGIDLFDRLLNLAEKEGHSVYFLGASNEVLANSINECRRKFPDLNIAGSHHGYFDKASEYYVVDSIKKSQADMLFVAISSPFKENFISRWRSDLGVKFVMGVGGTFDVVAGKVRRAPVWMQRCGMEWMFRVMQEPRRMFRRYLVTNSRFACMLIAEFWARLSH